MLAAGFRREAPSRHSVMFLREGDRPSNRTDWQSGEILVNLLDGGTKLEINSKYGLHKLFRSSIMKA